MKQPYLPTSRRQHLRDLERLSNDHAKRNPQQLADEEQRIWHELERQRTALEVKRRLTETNEERRAREIWEFINARGLYQHHLKDAHGLVTITRKPGDTR